MVTFKGFKKKLSDVIERRRLAASLARQKREERLKQLGQREIEKQTRVSEVRKAQLKRATLEAKILTQKARQAKAKEKISKTFRQEVRGTFQLQPQRPIGAALFDFPQPKKKKGKRPVKQRVGNTGGLGTGFRVI